MNASSHDGPAAVFRLVIDVDAVNRTDTTAGLGSVYFTTDARRNGSLRD